MHRKDRYPVIHVRQTITVPRCRIGTVMQRLYAGLHSRNARKFGKHRRGTLVLYGFDGKQDTETGVWTVVVEFRQYKGYTVQHNEYGVPEVLENPNAESFHDFRKLFR